MPDEDESSAGMKNTKIKFGKLKIIPNENGKK
jgi:hypothetical protein